MLKQRGLSLVELMITITLGLILMAALTSVFSATLGTNSRSLKLSQLQEESTAVMDLLVGDLRRAGYRGDAHLLVVDPDNAVTGFNNSIVVSQHPSEVAASCLLFDYDANNSSTHNGDPERFGYRLREGQVQRRQAGAACGDAGWEGLTSPDLIQVDVLEFVLTERMLDAVNEQVVEVLMVVSLPSDDQISRELATEVVLRNAF
ncbi:prepilin-type N-terminal cleavage/methylation domain-containing protein [Pseudidiomarina sp.]|uniref:prepilin-type N-terminal cleavage/methylation domain-containing protein n=1 Tax=Pseudidiomarina sp. TaxID=2081707 RepID=UPI003A97C122